MSRRRRFGVGLVVLGVLGTATAVGLVAAYTNRVHAQVGNLVPVLVLTSDVEPYQGVTRDMIEIKHVPARWAPETRITSVAAATDMIAKTPLQEGSFLQTGMIVYPSDIGPRQRKIALAVKADPVIAGDVAEGDIVAIYATFTSSNPKRPACLTMIAPKALIDHISESNDGTTERGNVTVSFIVNNRYTPPLLYAASFGEDIRLVALAPATETKRPKSSRCGPRLPDNEGNPGKHRHRRGDRRANHHNSEKDGSGRQDHRRKGKV